MTRRSTTLDNNSRLEDDRLCTLVMIGARPNGAKELLAVEDGYRESAESWKTLLRDLKRRGMTAPVVAMGDGALGFWAAVREVWPRPASRSAGVTSWSTCSTSCPHGYNRAPSARCTR